MHPGAQTWDAEDLKIVEKEFGARTDFLGPALLPIAFGSRFEDSVAPFLWLLPGVLGALLVVGTVGLPTTATTAAAPVPRWHLLRFA